MLRRELSNRNVILSSFFDGKIFKAKATLSKKQKRENTRYMEKYKQLCYNTNGYKSKVTDRMRHICVGNGSLQQQ